MQIVTESGIVIGDADIVEESMNLQESICSETHLRFGSCEASIFKIRLIRQADAFVGQRITASVLWNNESFQIGKYKIDSDKPTADRRYRDITAYDAMYDILHAEVSGWYNTILPSADSTVTLKAFRDSFLAHFGIEQENVTLVNDSMIVTKTIEPTSLSGKTVITAVCEINGCFGHIGRDGRFKYVFLRGLNLYPADDIYPSDDLFPGTRIGSDELEYEVFYPADYLYPSDDLYPAERDGIEVVSRSHYISAKYEDYETALIDKLQIRQEEDDIGCIYGTGDNCYIVQDNFLVYGKSSVELQVIAENLFRVISDVQYRPVHIEAKGNPCLEVGDGICVRTQNKDLYTYILQRTLKGIQALRDTYDAEGEQYQKEKVNSVQESIIQLKGKTNKIIRNVEETRLEIKDLEKGLTSKILQTAESIETEVKRAKSAEEDLSSRITQTAEELRFEVTARTSVYNEEVNTLQGGMDGNIDLSFFSTEDETVIATMSEKQCIYNGGYAFYQDVSIPSGTYKFSYEWLRSSGLYINASVELYNLSVSYDEAIYSKELGTAWLTTDVWTKEEFQFSLTKTSRIRFVTYFTAPIGYEDRVNSLYLTNIALYGTAQSVADSIVDMKTELLLQQDQISLRVEKDSVISEINQSSENITISAAKIDLEGLVNATEFVSKYATIDKLEASEAALNKLIAEKATIDELKASEAALNKLIADKASISDLDAVSLRVKNIESTYISAETVYGNFASFNELNAVSQRVRTIEANYVTAEAVSANYAKISDLESANARIDNLDTDVANIENTLTYDGYRAAWYSFYYVINCNPTYEEITVNGKTIRVCTDVGALQGSTKVLGLDMTQSEFSV